MSSGSAKGTEPTPSVPTVSRPRSRKARDLGHPGEWKPALQWLTGFRKSKSPPCRKKRDKDGAPSGVSGGKGWASPLIPPRAQVSDQRTGANLGHRAPPVISVNVKRSTRVILPR